MSEVKIRAWDLTSKRMIKWDDINAIEWCNDKLWFNGGDEFGEYRLLGNVELHKYLGGKQQLFEKDIIQFDNGEDERIGVVGDLGTHGVNILQIKGGFLNDKNEFIENAFYKDKSYRHLEKCYNIKKLGNVYENSELLKSKHRKCQIQQTKI